MNGPRLLAGLAVRLLPSWARDRYDVEFHSELAELSPLDRWAHALGLLLAAPQLRISILRGQALAAGFEPTIGCLTGLRHRWARAWTEDGQNYQRCRRCGLDRTDTSAGSADYMSPNAWPR